MGSREPRVSRTSLLLDSNLLLLLCIGSYDIDLIPTFKRVADYSIRDYGILAEFALGFRNLIATPHILTEVSNLANSLPSYLKAQWFGHFAGRIARIEERHIPASDLIGLTEFSTFGLTDTAITALAASTWLLTADNRHGAHLRRRQLCALSLNELRVAYQAG